MEDTKLDLMTCPEVSEMTRIPEATLRYYRHLGDRGPRSFKIGRRVMYVRSEVLAWLQEQINPEKVGA